LYRLNSVPDLAANRKTGGLEDAPQRLPHQATIVD
jgi:hypothetical protein